MKRRRMFRKNGTKTKWSTVVAENKEAIDKFDDENPEDNDEFDRDCEGKGDEEIDTEMDGGAFSSNYSTGSDNSWSCSSEVMSSEYSSYESSDESMERPVQKLVNWPSKGKLKRVKLSRKSDYSQPKSSRGLVSSSGYKKGRKSIHEDPRYNEQELCAALMVIIKVMKMDEAKPFNVPADPAALGTSDYVNVIDTPMDFGTIYSNLRNGSKYLNSEDVYKDVQLIWRHWCKYNYKGDYVLELMTSVKKKFMKHWIAANLYCEPTQKTNGHSLPPMWYDTRRKKYVAKYPEGHKIGGPNQSQPQLIKNEPCHSQKLQQSSSQPQAGSDIGSIGTRCT
nr:transcription factor gte1 [Quercus suber]